MLDTPNRHFATRCSHSCNRTVAGCLYVCGGISKQKRSTIVLSRLLLLLSRACYLNKAPVLQNVFINPRESNESVHNIQNEKITSIDANYFLRLPQLTGRLTGFYTRFQNTTDVNFFFVDSGLGSDFVQEVLTDMDKLHLGVELGLEYQL